MLESEALESQQVKNDLLVSSTTDLKYQLNRKRSAQQATLHCCCKQLITFVLSNCRCGSHASHRLVFYRLSMSPTSTMVKRQRSRQKYSPMKPACHCEHGRAQSKQVARVAEYDTSDHELDNMHDRTNAHDHIPLVDYAALNRKALNFDDRLCDTYSAMAESRTSLF